MASSKPNPRRANGHRRDQVRRWLKAQALPCALCGQGIDYGLPPGHPLSFEVDEIVPVSLGGSPFDRANVQPAHRICNERKGNRMPSSPAGERAGGRGLRAQAPPIPTTEW